MIYARFRAQIAGATSMTGRSRDYVVVLGLCGASACAAPRLHAQTNAPDRRDCVKIERQGVSNSQRIRFSATCSNQLNVSYCHDKGVAPVCGKAAYSFNLGAPYTVQLGTSRQGAHLRYAACDWNRSAYHPGSQKKWDGASDAYECR